MRGLSAYSHLSRAACGMLAAFIACVVTLIVLSPVAFASDEPGVIESGSCGDDLVYSLTYDGVLTISGSGAMYDYDAQSNPAPWKNHRSILTKVSISEGCTHIGSYAFYCSKVTELCVPSSVTSLGEGFASWSSQLESVAIDGPIAVLPEKSFERCGCLCDIKLPDTLVSIGASAFFAAGEGTLVIPDGVKSIGANALVNCGFEEIHLSDSLEVLEGANLYGCDNLRCVNIPDTLAELPAGCFTNARTDSPVLEVCIPESVTSLGKFSYSGVKSVSFSSVAHAESYQPQAMPWMVPGKTLVATLDGREVPLDAFYEYGGNTGLMKVSGFTHKEKLAIVSYGKRPDGAAAVLMSSGVLHIAGGGDAESVSLDNPSEPWAGYAQDVAHVAFHPEWDGDLQTLMACPDFAWANAQADPMEIVAENVVLSTTAYSYNGKVKKPSVKVYVRGERLTSGVDYYVTYASGRKAVGTYKVTVKGKGQFAGQIAYTYFVINPQKVKARSFYKSGKYLVARWYKPRGEFGGFNVQISTSSKFDEEATISKWYNRHKLRITMGGAKKGQTYYFRVQAKKVKNGKTYLGPWSTVKKRTF